MPFFRRKSEKSKNDPPAPLSVPTHGGTSLKRTPSNRSDRSPLTPSSLNGDIGVPESVLGATGGGKRPPNLLLQSTTLQETYQGSTDAGPSSPMRTSSRLSKTLGEILHDQNGVACFLQYMKAQKAAHLIQFWLDAESFKVSTSMRVRTHSLNKPSGNLGNRSFSSNDTQKSESIEGKHVTSLPNINSCKEDSISKDDENRPDCTERVKPSGMGGQQGADNSVIPDVIPSVHSAKDEPPKKMCDPSEDPGGSEKAGTVGGVGLGEGVRQSKDGEETKGTTDLSKQDIKTKLKKCIQQDAVTIFTKYISQDAPSPIGVSEELRAVTIRRICQENGLVEPDAFSDCQEFVFHRMEKEHFSGFEDSEYHCKHQVDVLTGGKVYLADILYNELALSYFMEFMDSEEACHLLQFWLVADNFQQHLANQGGQYNPTQAQDDAMVLYDKYFSLQATQPLGFDDNIRFAVESNICREGGPLPDCFAKPRDLVLSTLEQYYFPAYMQSEMYYKYLSDLVSTVQTAHVPHKPKHRRTESDASSEHSAGSQSVGVDSIKNTLLAMDTSHMKRAFTHIEDDMRIDSMLLNPDELWKRTDPGLMSLGKVNNLGQFESLFDPEPDRDKKKGTRFFKKKKEKEKEQEDMALRVAQMIINDVTTMTQTGDIYAGVSSSPKLSTRNQQDSAIQDSRGDNS